MSRASAIGLVVALCGVLLHAQTEQTVTLRNCVKLVGLDHRGPVNDNDWPQDRELKPHGPLTTNPRIATIRITEAEVRPLLGGYTGRFTFDSGIFHLGSDQTGTPPPTSIGVASIDGDNFVVHYYGNEKGILSWIQAYHIRLTLLCETPAPKGYEEASAPPPTPPERIRHIMLYQNTWADDNGGKSPIEMNPGIPLNKITDPHWTSGLSHVKWKLPKGEYLSLYDADFWKDGYPLVLPGNGELQSLDLPDVGWNDKAHSARVETRTFEDAVRSALSDWGPIVRFDYHGKLFNIGKWERRADEGSKKVAAGRITLFGSDQKKVDFTVVRDGDKVQMRVFDVNNGILDAIMSVFPVLTETGIKDLWVKLDRLATGNWPEAAFLLVSEVAMRM